MPRAYHISFKSVAQPSPFLRLVLSPAASVLIFLVVSSFNTICDRLSAMQLFASSQKTLNAALMEKSQLCRTCILMNKNLFSSTVAQGVFKEDLPLPSDGYRDCRCPSQCEEIKWQGKKKPLVY